MSDLVMLDPLIEIIVVVKGGKGGPVDRHDVDDVGEEKARHCFRVCTTHDRGDLALTERDFYRFRPRSQRLV